MQSQSNRIKNRAKRCQLSLKGSQYQTSFCNHKSKKHQIPDSKNQINNKQQTIKFNKQKNPLLGPMVHKNDVEFNQKAVQCKNLSELTFIQTIYPILRSIYPKQKKLQYGSLDSYGQFAQKLQAIINENIDKFDEYFLPSKQRDYCYQKTLKLAQEYELQKIHSLTKDIQLCKPHIRFHSQIHMIWDLIKVIALDVAKTIYLHLLCIVVEQYYSLKREQFGSNKEKMFDYEDFKEKIDKFKKNAYPIGNKQKLQELQQGLKEYVKNWTNIFENQQYQNTKCMRKTPKRFKKCTQPITQYD